MRKIDQLPDREYILGSLFIVANKLDKIMDKELKPFDITSKQWILSAVIDTLFDEPPTIKEAANEMGSSHQNIKQVALKLENRGLLNIEKDKSDGRVSRLVMSEESDTFWKSTHEKGNLFTNNMFEGIEDEKLSIFRETLGKILDNLVEFENAKVKED